MAPKKAFLFLNGAPPKSLPDLSEYDLVCAVDGGYKHLQKQNILPDLITGDFDSIQDLPKTVEIVSTPDQNFTDFHKALEILQAKNFLQIDVYGGTGNEQDHYLGNLSTALEWRKKLKLTFYDDFGKSFFIHKSHSEKNVLNRTISLLPFPSASGISTKGLQYPLKNEKLTFGARIGTRNKAIENAVEVSYEQGALFIFISHPIT
jgi:thiamine pyrophosphokinase